MLNDTYMLNQHTEPSQLTLNDPFSKTLLSRLLGTAIYIACNAV